MASQLTSMKGWLRRAPLAWIALATAVLPVPDGPVISTLMFLGATIATWRSMSAIAWLRPTSASTHRPGRHACVGSGPLSSASRAISWASTGATWRENNSTSATSYSSNGPSAEARWM